MLLNSQLFSLKPFGTWQISIFSFSLKKIKKLIYIPNDAHTINYLCVYSINGGLWRHVTIYIVEQFLNATTLVSVAPLLDSWTRSWAGCFQAARVIVVRLTESTQIFMTSLQNIFHPGIFGPYSFRYSRGGVYRCSLPFFPWFPTLV